jgi:choline dehydrogenase-like flavoprotein
LKPVSPTLILTVSQDHSSSGSLHLTYGDSWLPNVGDIFIAAEQSGLRTNKDVNSGDPIGMGMGSVCIYEGKRLTASSAYLAHPPSNLTVLPNSPVANVIFNGKTATGVKTIDGRTFYATKEVIISGGALNTPQILMLSGIGPQHELEKHGIPVIHDLPMLGQNLQDHCSSSVGIAMKREANNPSSGHSQIPAPMGWFKLPKLQTSEEYSTLTNRMKSFLQKPTIPAFEVATVNSPALFIHIWHSS